MKKTIMLKLYLFVGLLLLVGFAAVLPQQSFFNLVKSSTASVEEEDPAEVRLGERLFRETRFAQYFFAHNKGVNLALEKSDASIVDLPSSKGKFSNPYQGSINCASCHFVDENLESQGMRAYNDFAVRSLVPFRKEDQEKVTPRNSPQMVGSVKKDAMLHYDGEFSSAQDLVVESWLGRNFGWLSIERKAAIEHMAKVIREDDGSFAEDKVSYRQIFEGHQDYSSPKIPRVKLTELSSEQIVQLAADMVVAYMESLVFEKKSAFDQFLRVNSLPSEKKEGENAKDFHARLLKALENKNLRFVEANKLEFHSHFSQFGERELEGMKIFLSENRGNCASCHHLPDFTDGSFHNTAVSQMEFDRVHGPGAFLKANFTDIDKLKSIPTKKDRKMADSGLHFVLHHPQFSDSWSKLVEPLCATLRGEIEGDCNLDSLRKNSFARFKTPNVRDLGHSEPYFHDGSAENLEQAVAQYIGASNLHKMGRLREGAKELGKIQMTGKDVKPLTAFLRSLDEDYN